MNHLLMRINYLLKNSHTMPFMHRAGRICAVTATIFLSACASTADWNTSTGPSQEQVQEGRDSQRLNGIQVVDVDASVARKLIASRKHDLSAEFFAGTAQSRYLIGPGDVIELILWEAPPAMLFGSSPFAMLSVAKDSSQRSGPVTSQATTFPEQMVNSQGEINMPFAGQIPVVGRTPQQVEAEIVQRLKDKANQPQVLVRVTSNNTANVTVVGDVNNSMRVPLTPRGERLLDVLAAAGGVRQPVGKTTIQLTRSDLVQSLPLDTIIRDPKKNVVLMAGDVITALYQPLSFTVLGAAGKNDEISFETQGVTLAQALARAGGLVDDKADARAVFLFRFEEPSALDWSTPPAITPEGRVPVIYQLNLKDPASFFIAQNFPVDNKDMLYISNAPLAEIKKFMTIISQGVYTIRNISPTTFTW